MQPEATKTPPTKVTASTPAVPTKSGYGKRPKWHWVILYIVVAIVVYGIIYFAFIHKSGTTSGY